MSVIVLEPGASIANAVRTSTTVKTVRLKPGQYVVNASINITNPGLTIESTGEAGEVVIHGSSQIPQNQWTLVNDSRIRYKQQYVYKTAINPSILNAIEPRGFKQRVAPSDLDVYYNDVKLQHSRWPRGEQVFMTKVIDPGNAETKYGGKLVIDRVPPVEWTASNNVWVDGLRTKVFAWMYNKVTAFDRATKTVDLQHYEFEGLQDVSHHYEFQKPRFFFDNIFEELQPNEYYIDFESNTLYIALDSPISSSVTIAHFKSDMFIINANDVTIRNITFKLGRSRGISSSKRNGLKVINCRFEDLNAAISFFECNNCLISSCVLSNIGATGIYVKGEGCRVTNCYISKCAQVHRIYCPGILVAGSGGIVDRNTITDMPHGAIIFSGNDHVIEQNLIFDVLKEFEDFGCIYTAASNNPLGGRGSIIRNNVIHNVIRDHTLISAIYLDIYTSGVKVTNNVIYRMNHPRLNDKWYSGVHINGGNNNEVSSNILIQCELLSLGGGPMGTTAQLDLLVAEYNKLTTEQKTKYGIPQVATRQNVSGFGNAVRNDNVQIKSSTSTSDVKMLSPTRLQIISRKIDLDNNYCKFGENDFIGSTVTSNNVTNTTTEREKPLLILTTQPPTTTAVMKTTTSTPTTFKPTTSEPIVTLQPVEVQVNQGLLQYNPITSTTSKALVAELKQLDTAQREELSLYLYVFAGVIVILMVTLIVLSYA